MKTKEEVVRDMCYTWRHDYGLDRQEHDGPGGLITAGLTDAERKLLWRQMEQLYDNCIAPLLIEQTSAINDVNSGDRIVLPKSREHAENMIKVAQFYLDHQ